MNAHLKGIQEGLIEYLPPINTVSKHKCMMCHAMQKTRAVPFKRFMARLTDLKNHLQMFPGSDNRNKMDEDKLNKILLYAVPSGRDKHSYLQGQDFDSNPYKKTCDKSERMEIVGQVYEGGKPYKTINRADSNRAGHIRNKKGGQSAFPSKPEKGRSGKSNKINPGNRNYQPTGKKIYYAWPRTLL